VGLLIKSSYTFKTSVMVGILGSVLSLASVTILSSKSSSLSPEIVVVIL